MSKDLTPCEHFKKTIIGHITVARKFTWRKNILKRWLRESGGNFSVIEVINSKTGEQVYVTNT